MVLCAVGSRVQAEFFDLDVEVDGHPGVSVVPVAGRQFVRVRDDAVSDDVGAAREDLADDLSKLMVVERHVLHDDLRVLSHAVSAVLDDDSKKVVDAIEGVATDGNDRPHEDVVLTSVTVVAVS